MNLIPLFGVVFLDWSVFALLYVFWLETLGLSFFNALRIFFSSAEQDGPYFSKAAGYIIFRVFILGFYLVFIVTFIGLMMAGKQGKGHEWVEYLLLLDPIFRFTVMSFFVIKLIEFIYFYFIKDERSQTYPDTYRNFFDGRLIVIHVVLVGGFFMFQYFSNLWGDRTGLIAFALVFVIIKSFVEMLTPRFQVEKLRS